MDWLSDPNPWVVQIVSGIISAVVGGLIVEAVKARQAGGGSGFRLTLGPTARKFLAVELFLGVLLWVLGWMGQQMNAATSGHVSELMTVLFFLGTGVNLAAALIGYEKFR